MDASTIPKGQSKERTDDRLQNEPGIYEHKDTKGIFVTAEGEAGVIQADALMSPVWKDAWHRIGDVPSRLELLKLRKIQELKDAKESAAQKKAEEDEIAAAVASVTTKAEPKKELPVGGETYDPSLTKKG